MEEELTEIIEGKSLIKDNKEYDLFILKSNNNKYICYFNIIDIETKDIYFSVLKECDDLEMAKKEFEIWNFQEEE